VGLVVLIVSSFLALVTELTGRLMSALGVVNIGVRLMSALGVVNIGVVLAVIYTFICHKDKLLK